MTFVVLVLVAGLSFGVYCVFKQYLWQRGNRLRQRRDENLDSPDEDTPIIRRDRSSNGSFANEESIVQGAGGASGGTIENLSASATVTESRKKGGIRKSKRLAERTQELVTLVPLKEITLLLDLDPRLPSFTPQTTELQDCARFLQRIQLLTAGFALQFTSSKESLSTFGKVLELTLRDPNSEAGKKLRMFFVFMLYYCQLLRAAQINCIKPLGNVVLILFQLNWNAKGKRTRWRFLWQF